MSELTEMTCEACRFDAPKATDEERAEFSKQIPDWEVVTVDGVERLKRQFKLKNYRQALDFTSTWRAVGVAVVGFIPYVVATGIVYALV